MPLKIQAAPSQTVSQCHDRTLVEGAFGGSTGRAGEAGGQVDRASSGFKLASGTDAVGVGCSIGDRLGAGTGCSGAGCLAEAGSDCRSPLGIILRGWIGTEFDRRFGSTRFGSTRFGSTRFGSTKLKDEARVPQDFRHWMS